MVTVQGNERKFLLESESEHCSNAPMLIARTSLYRRCTFTSYTYSAHRTLNPLVRIIRVCYVGLSCTKIGNWCYFLSILPMKPSQHTVKSATDSRIIYFGKWPCKDRIYYICIRQKSNDKSMSCAYKLITSHSSSAVSIHKMFVDRIILMWEWLHVGFLDCWIWFKRFNNCFCFV